MKGEVVMPIQEVLMYRFKHYFYMFYIIILSGAMIIVVGINKKLLIPLEQVTR